MKSRFKERGFEGEREIEIPLSLSVFLVTFCTGKK